MSVAEKDIPLSDTLLCKPLSRQEKVPATLGVTTNKQTGSLTFSSASLKEEVQSTTVPV